MALTNKELKVRVLRQIWGFASSFHEGIEEGELSDFYMEEVYDGDLTEEEAHRAQQMMEHEADLIHRKLSRLQE